MNGFKRFKGFQFSNVVQPSKKGNRLFFLAILGGTIVATDQLLRYQAFRTNIFLTSTQIKDMSIKNHSIQGNSIIQGHPINQVDQQSQLKFIIIGGGIIGLTQALKLLQNGHHVTILDSAASVATECSAFNGNVFNPLYFLPLVTRDNLIYMIKNLFEKPELTTVRFNFSAMLEKNFITFSINALLKSMSNEQQIHNSRCQLRIGQKTLEEVERLKPTGMFKGGHLEAKGQLAFFGTDEKVLNYGKRLELLQIPHIKINQFSQIENYLSTDLKTDPNVKVFNRFKKALILTTESNLETKQICLRILEHIQQHYSKQFSIAYSTKVDRFVINEQNEVKGVNSNKGVVLGDRFILCMAHKTKYLAEKLKLALPILPAKGWAMGANVPEGPDFSFIRHFTLNTPNYFATITMNKLRLAGCAEMCKDTPSEDASTEWGAIQILNRFNEQTGYSMKMSDFSVRTCFRPLTPDDVAIISEVPSYKNVFINAGHGSRGMSYCFGAADIMNEIIGGSKDYQDFSLSRYYFV